MGQTAARMQSETVVFRDASSEWTSSASAAVDSTRLSTVQNDDSLDAFFKRPISIYQTAWTPLNVTPLTATINPWSLFFTNPRVANRICNYNLLTAKLKIKVLVNGNSFYYGRLMVDYVPLPSLDTSMDFTLTTLGNAVAASNRQHLYLDPTTSMGGEMELPFIWPNDNVNVTFGDIASLGSLYLRELVQLKHANAATTPVEIVIMAWAEDVTLAIPTTLDSYGLVAQANEYEMRPASALASATAGLMGKLSSVPIIGPYAKATQMVASSLGAVARMFGYSRPPIISDPIHVRPNYIGSIAATDTGDPVQKLTVDSKQELSVDPRIFGADTGDELVISRLAAVESYYYQFPWTVGRVPDACLFSVRPHPRVNVQTAGITYMPACCFASAPFLYWRGCMRYRFQIVGSGFHRGRLKVMWDPNYISSPETNVAFTRIVDISADREFTIDVPWGNARAFLPCEPMSTSPALTTTTAAFSSVGTGNGVLAVYVLNTLTTPNSATNNDITVLVSVSMGDDAEFAVPEDTSFYNLSTVYNYTPQSNETEVDAEGAPVSEGVTESMLLCTPSADRSLVYFGERIQSFRQLLRRYNLHSSYFCGSTTAPTTGDVLWYLVNPDFPQYRGYTPNPLHRTVTSAPYNYVLPTLLNFLTPAFLGVRGSIRSKYKVRCGARDVLSFSVSRASATTSTPANGTIAIPQTGQYKYAAALSNNPTCYMGAAVTVPEHQPVLEVEFPYYKGQRFDGARCVTGTNANSPLGLNPTHHAVHLSLTGTTTKTMDRYIAVGEDFTLFYFMGAPPMRGLANPAPL